MNNTQWKAPSMDQLDFTQNCTLYGMWLAAYMSPDRWNQDNGWALGINTARSIFLFNSSLPSDWARPTYSQAANWWVEAYIPTFNTIICQDRQAFSPGSVCENWRLHLLSFNQYVFEIPAQKCRTEMCKAMARTGNPDLAGIGIIIAYFSEAILVTLFFLAFVLDSTIHKRWHRDSTSKVKHTIDVVPSPPTSKTDYMIDIFRHTVKPFFESAAFLSIAMLIAALSTISTATTTRASLRKSQDSIPVLSNFYDVKLTLLSALFCIFPVVVLSLLNDQGKRGRITRLVLLLIIYLFAIVLVFLAPKAEWDAGITLTAPIPCDLRGGITYKNGLKSLQYLIFILPLSWTLCNFIITNPCNWKLLEDSRTLQIWRRNWLLVTGIGNLLAMWIFLGCFIVLRNEILSVAGEMDSSNELGFGQVLALFAWGPVGLALGSQLFFGPKKAYEKEATSDHTVNLNGGKGEEREFLVYR